MDSYLSEKHYHVVKLEELRQGFEPNSFFTTITIM